MEKNKVINVCHVTSAHSRYDGRIFLKQCSSLAKNNYNVTLLCCDTLDDEVKNNVNVVSIDKHFSSLRDRIFNSKRMLKKKCLEINADIYQFHDPDLLSLALYMKRKKKVVIFDSHEDYPSLFLERQNIPFFLRKFLSSIYLLYEKHIFKKIDGVICVADYQLDRIKKINSNAVIITNYPIIDNDFKKNKNVKNTLCFAGGVRADWNHDTVIKAIKDIDDVKYIVAGSYKESYLETLKSYKGFEKVEFLGKLDKKGVKDLYSNSNVGIALCSYRPNTCYKKGSLGNTKIFEYMMYELPVIFTDFDVFKNILKEGKFGIAVNPYDSKEVEAMLRYLLDNPKIAKEMGSIGRKLVVEKYNWETQAKILIKFYNDVVKSNE